MKGSPTSPPRLLLKRSNIASKKKYPSFIVVSNKYRERNVYRPSNNTQKAMERGLMMALHSLLIGGLAYLLMVNGLKQSPRVAEDRSVLLGAVVLAYMVLFGHGLPTQINAKIM